MSSTNPLSETIPVEVRPIISENLLDRGHGTTPPDCFYIVILSRCRPQPRCRSLMAGLRNCRDARLDEHRVQLPDERVISARCSDHPELVLPHEFMIASRGGIDEHGGRHAIVGQDICRTTACHVEAIVEGHNQRGSLAHEAGAVDEHVCEAYHVKLLADQAKVGFELVEGYPSKQALRVSLLRPHPVVDDDTGMLQKDLAGCSPEQRRPGTSAKHARYSRF